MYIALLNESLSQPNSFLECIILNLSIFLFYTEYIFIFLILVFFLIFYFYISNFLSTVPFWTWYIY